MKYCKNTSSNTQNIAQYMNFIQKLKSINNTYFAIFIDNE